MARPLMDRPIGSLLSIRIGTVLKAYVLYLAIVVVLGLIGIVFVLSHRSSASSTPASGSVSWTPDAGAAITPAQFRSVHAGASMAAVRARFGVPATSGKSPIAGESDYASSEKCLGYRSSVAAGKLFLFCFDDGRLVDKQTF